MEALTKRLIVLFSLIYFANIADGQMDTSKKDDLPAIKFSGFVEAYYCYDFNQPVNNALPDFVTNFNRNNEITINLAFLKASYNTDRVRANMALGAGTYMNAAYGLENGVMKNIYEADAGVKLTAKKNIWIDAGVMPSHIGFEDAYSPDCWNLTRSMLADNSPYYESGARLSYTSDSGKWYLAAFMLNGWQRIQRADGNSSFCGATQITYKPTGDVTINYSTFLGNDKPDSVARTRIFHDFYGIFQITKKLGVIAGVDYGMEQKSKGSTQWNNWYGAALILRYKPINKTAIAVRAEYYRDDNGVIIETGTPYGFNTTGLSANFDYHILENVLWRLEYKEYVSADNIFSERSGTMMNTLPMATTSISISF